MTFSALLFLLYLTLTFVSFAGGSWVAHLRPAPTEARRVTDAVERAGLAQVLGSLPAAGACLICVTGAAVYLSTDVPDAGWLFTVAPLIGAVAASVVTFGAGRRLIRVTGQLSDSRTSDVAAMLSGQAALSATLLSASVAGMLVTGVQTLYGEFLSPENSLVAAWLAASSAALLLVLFGRSLSVAWAAAEEGTGQTAEITPATLARLVGGSFGASVLRSAGLFAAVAFGQVALASAGLGEFSLGGASRYAQLLIPLGLLAALFGSQAIRSSEREPASWAWLRGGGVTLLLAVAGCWGVAGLAIDGDLKRPICATVTLLLLGVALSTFATTLARTPSGFGDDLPAANPGPRPGGIAVVPPSGGAQSLGLGLMLCLPLATALVMPGVLSDSGLPDHTLQALVLGASLSVLPTYVIWQMATDILRATSLCEILATEGQASVRSPVMQSEPAPAFLLIASTLLPLSAICSVDLLLRAGGNLGPAVPWVLGIGIFLGALSVLQTTSTNRSLARRGARELSRLSSTNPGEPLLVPLGAGLDAARAASSQRQWVWLLTILLPPGLLGLLHESSAREKVPGLVLGYLLGVITSAALVSIRLDSQSMPAARPHASLAVPAAFAVLGWTVSFLLQFSAN